jgi:acyl dehydratase
MAGAIRIVTDWVGDPVAVIEYGVRFTRPVPVPDDDVGAVISVSGTVVDKREDHTVVVALQATCDGVSVLGKAQAVVRLS